MSNFKGTKGKWGVSRCQISEEIRVDGGLVTVAKVYSYDILCAENDIEEAKANAQLIAHAPEMLEMLNLLVDRMEENDLGNFPSVLRAKELIKKATEI